MSTKNQRLFERWLALMNERRGRVSIKKKPTNSEADYITSALKQASEEQLLLMLDWAFYGTDGYAKLLQGKTSFDGRPAQEYLGIATLMKDKMLDKRLDLGEQWANRTIVQQPADHDKWLEEEALPALDRLADSPESYDVAYDWWCQHMPRHEGGPTSDQPFVQALMRLRAYRARDKS